MSRNWKLPRPGDPEIATLLTEGQANRENISLYSEDLGNVQGWLDGGTNGLVNANATLAPDGSLTADRLIDDGTVGPGYVVRLQPYSLTAGLAWTFSVFAKADQQPYIYLRYSDYTDPADGGAFFNLDTGVVESVEASMDSAAIEDVGNGWYRCSVTMTNVAADTTGSVIMYVGDGPTIGDLFVPLDGTISVFFWGMQMEQASAPTAYIPTTIAARTITGFTSTGNFQDDVHTALETVLETTGATADLWKKYKQIA